MKKSYLLTSMVCGCLTHLCLYGEDPSMNSDQLSPLLLEGEQAQKVPVADTLQTHPSSPESSTPGPEQSPSSASEAKPSSQPSDTSTPQEPSTPETTQDEMAPTSQEPQQTPEPPSQEPSSPAPQQVQETPPSKVSKEECSSKIQSDRIEVRQITGKGIGYTHGYTTLVLFLTPFKRFETYLPFLDLRGHHFDNNKYAANIGLGLRGASSSKRSFWGINAYYDYRQTSHKNFKQASLGIEILSRYLDWRINGYYPFGGTKSHAYDKKFSHFEGNHLFIQHKRSFAMPGVDTEFAYHWNPNRNLEFTAAAGPYYYHGHFDQFAWGGKVRAKFEFWNCISFEGNASYDNLFKWVGQGQISLTIPLGSKKKGPQFSKSNCSRAFALQKRFIQPVERAEIIVSNHHRSRELALNPATGLPWNFIFVNNTSHSNGTFESPYPTLLQAQNASNPGDIIYVFTGDGTSNGMNAGITLKDIQQFLGSSTDHTIATQIGNITIPAQTSTPPLITNPGGIVVTLANSNTVSGFQIGASTTGISGTNGNGTYISSNIFATTAPNSTIVFSDMSGLITITKNTFNGIQGPNAIGIETTNTNTSPNYQIYNNTFFILEGGAIQLISKQSSSVNFSITGNRFMGSLPSPSPGNVGIQPNVEDSSTMNGIISGNTFSNLTLGVQMEVATSSTPANIFIQGNRFDMGTGTLAIELATAGINPITNLSIVNNTINSGSDGGIDIGLNDGITNTFISNNTITNTTGPAQGGGISFGVAGSNAHLNATVTNNILTNDSNGGLSMLDLSVSSSTCINMSGNVSTTGYTLSTGLGGVIHIVDGFQITNLPMNSFTITGNVVPVPSCD